MSAVSLLPLPQVAGGKPATHVKFNDSDDDMSEDDGKDETPSEHVRQPCEDEEMEAILQVSAERESLHCRRRVRPITSDVACLNRR